MYWKKPQKELCCVKKIPAYFSSLKNELGMQRNFGQYFNLAFILNEASRYFCLNLIFLLLLFLFFSLLFDYWVGNSLMVYRQTLSMWRWDKLFFSRESLQSNTFFFHFSISFNFNYSCVPYHSDSNTWWLLNKQILTLYLSLNTRSKKEGPCTPLSRNPQVIVTITCLTTMRCPATRVVHASNLTYLRG